MDIICPHCGTEYDAEESEYGRFVKCEICGKECMECMGRDPLGVTVLLGLSANSCELSV